MAKLDIQASIAPSAATADIAKPSSEIKNKANEKLQQFIKEESRLVKGIFQNFETPGLALRLQVRKYKGLFYDETLEDGKEYSVPLYIARHLNGIDATAVNEKNDGKIGTCSYQVHSYIMDINGNPTVNKAKTKRRYGFQAMEFSTGTNAA